jgi:hypothetical protein
MSMSYCHSGDHYVDTDEREMENDITCADCADEAASTEDPTT